jgi:hypothetical protein
MNMVANSYPCCSLPQSHYRTPCIAPSPIPLLPANTDLLCTQTPWSLHLHTRSSQANAQEPIFQPFGGGGGVCTPRASCSFTPSTAAVPTAPEETASEDQPLTSPPLRPGLGGGGALWRAGYAPGPRPAPVDNVLSTLCTACPLYSKQSCLYI